jgi:hypothetical protein
MINSNTEYDSFIKCFGNKQEYSDDYHNDLNTIIIDPKLNNDPKSIIRDFIHKFWNIHINDINCGGKKLLCFIQSCIHFYNHLEYFDLSFINEFNKFFYFVTFLVRDHFITDPMLRKLYNHSILLIDDVIILDYSSDD